MRRQIVLVLVATLAVSGIVSTAQATSSFGVTLGELVAPSGNTYTDFAEPTTFQSWAWAQAGNGTSYQSNVPGAAVIGPDINATAAVAGPAATATGWTEAGKVHVLASATTGPGSSTAYAYAEQYIWFQVTDDGAVEFAMDYDIVQTLSPSPGETAYADSWVGLDLFRWVEPVAGPAYAEWIDGDAFYATSSASGTLGVSDAACPTGGFGVGEWGYVYLRADGNVAAVVPVPGAVLLGILGTGLVGVLRRRKGL